MKKFKLLSLLATFVLLVTSCVNTDVGSKDLAPQTNNAKVRFYGVKTPEATRGVAQYDRLWHPGTTIKVKFLEDPYNMKETIMDYAEQWDSLASVNFDFVEPNEDAHVRIAFDWNGINQLSWSYVGTDCKMAFDQSQPTVSFGYFDDLDEDEIRSEVLRVFGSILGLELETRHIDFNEDWWADDDVAEEYWMDLVEDTDLTWEILKEYVVEPMSASAANTVKDTTFDPESVMNWPWYLNGRRGELDHVDAATTLDNYELSEGDKAFVQKLYPKEGDVKPVVATTDVTDNIIFNDGADYEWVEDNGFWMLRGDAETITSITIDDSPVSLLNVSGLMNLTHIDIQNAVNLSSINLFGNLLIENVVLKNTAINFDEEKLVVFATSLLNRMDNSSGAFVIGDNDPVERIWEICDKKNWTVTPAPSLLIYASNKNITLNEGVKGYWKVNTETGGWELWGKPSVTEVSFSGNDMAYLDVSRLTGLRTFDIQNATNLASLDLSSNLLVENVTLKNTAINTNETAFKAFVNSLPNRTGKTPGSFTAGSNDRVDWIQTICLSKNWNVFPKVGVLATTNAKDNITFNLGAECEWVRNNNRWELRGNATTITKLVANGGDISSLNISGLTHLQHLDVRNCSLHNLDLSACPAIATVYCEGNPFLANQTAASNFGRSLPTRTSGGKIVVGVEDQINWIWDECDYRGWRMEPLPPVIATVKAGNSNAEFSYTAYPGKKIIVDYQGQAHEKDGNTIRLRDADEKIYIRASSKEDLEEFRGCHLNISGTDLTNCTKLKRLSYINCDIAGFTNYSFRSVEELCLDENPITLLRIQWSSHLRSVSLKGCQPFIFDNPYAVSVQW